MTDRTFTIIATIVSALLTAIYIYAYTTDLTEHEMEAQHEWS